MSDILSDLVSVNLMSKRNAIEFYQLIIKEIDIINTPNKELPFKIIQLKIYSIFPFSPCYIKNTKDVKI